MQPNHYNMLHSANITQIHEASLEVLEQTGVAVDHPEARGKLADAGARLVDGGNRVFFPREMVERVLKQFPKRFTCAGRTPEYDLQINGTRPRTPCTRTAGGALNLYDFSTDRSRPLTITDCAHIAGLVDALPSLDMVGALTPQDIPQQTYDIETVKVLLENGRKHIWALTTSSKNLAYQLEMMEIAGGGRTELSRRPLCSGIVCLIEPLYFPEDEIQRLLLYGRYKLPVRVPLVPMVGANAPFTLAGTLVQTNAEALGSLVVLQTLCPGIPTWYYAIMETMEMRSGTLQLFNPEVIMLCNAALQMARHYQLPAISLPGVGPNTQSHQIMFERGTGLIINALAGASEIGGIGALCDAMMISPEMIAIDSEIVSFVKRYLEGFDIDDDTLAVDAIHRQCRQGRFLEDDHTFQHLRRELRFRPLLFDWKPLMEEVQAEGETNIFQRARETVDQIERDHEVPPLNEDQQKELDRVLTAAKKELGVS